MKRSAPVDQSRRPRRRTHGGHGRCGHGRHERRGVNCSVASIRRRARSCSGTRYSRRAALRRRQSGRSTVRGDRRCSLDLASSTSASRFGAPGDFAQICARARSRTSRSDGTGTEGRAGNCSPRADQRNECRSDGTAGGRYAGVWGHHANHAGRAASGGVELTRGHRRGRWGCVPAIGDERLQKRSTGRVSPKASRREFNIRTARQGSAAVPERGSELV